jgi:hypothetical protein
MPPLAEACGGRQGPLEEGVSGRSARGFGPRAMRRLRELPTPLTPGGANPLLRSPLSRSAPPPRAPRLPVLALPAQTRTGFSISGALIWRFSPFRLRVVRLSPFLDSRIGDSPHSGSESYRLYRVGHFFARRLGGGHYSLWPSRGQPQPGLSRRDCQIRAGLRGVWVGQRLIWKGLLRTMSV